MILLSRSSYADASTSVSLNPPVISGQSLGIGGNFTLSASIQGVTDLWGWSLGLSWDPSILQMMNYSEGSFLSSAGQTSLTASPIDNNDGALQNMNDVLISQNSASGSGTLASFIFQIVGNGSTEINLTNVQLLGPASSNGSNPQITTTVANAVFNNSEQASTVQPDPSATGVFSAVLSGTTSTSSITLGPSPDPVGSTLKIDIYISGAANVWGWTIPTVTWNPAVMNITHAAFGPYLTDNTPNDDPAAGIGTQSSLFNYALGTIEGGLTEAIEGNDVAVGSAGVVATLTFTIVGYGTSTVNIAGAYLPSYTNPTSGPSATCNPATVDVVSPTPSPSPSPSPAPSSIHGPIASFTPQNGTVYYVNETVLLDASSSTPGYDAVTCPITNYAWLVEYSNSSLFGAFSGEEISFTVFSPENLEIILVVTAPDLNSPPSSSYTNTSTTSAWIQIESAPVQEPATIQVFTNKGVYGPQELVTMYALVTYDNAPVADKEVAFAVLYPNGTICGIFVASTNETGYATWAFRLPWPSSDPQSLFGTWSIVASVDVCQVVVTGSVNFTYNYIISVIGIQLPSSVQRSQSITIKVTVQNLTNTPSILSVTICDSQQVPIDCSTTNIPSTSGGPVTVTLTFTIPSWAYVGTATVYVDVLTNLPTDGGVPLCPQQTANFQITS